MGNQWRMTKRPYRNDRGSTKSLDKSDLRSHGLVSKVMTLLKHCVLFLRGRAIKPFNGSPCKRVAHESLRGFLISGASPAVALEPN